MKFCRQCGQDYYQAVRGDAGILPHPLGTDTEDDETQPYYLMLASEENDWREDRVPEEWRDARASAGTPGASAGR